MDNCDHSKVFVGGISWETTEDTLRDHFGSYGTVVGSVIAKNRATGSPRGFAFVSFSDASALDKVLVDTHTILGRTVEVKKAVPRNEQNQTLQEPVQGQNRNCGNNGTKSNSNSKTKKIFVGGLSANLTEENFKFYFEKFGRITDVVVMHDSVTRRPRGFGFITFDSEDSVEEVMQRNFHELCGKLVEVKRAVPKEVSSSVTITSSISNSSRDSNFTGSHQHQLAASYRPIYDVLPSYVPFTNYGGYPYGATVFGGGYPVGCYGMATVATVSPSVPWASPAVVSMRGPGGPLPLTVYPAAYLNSGYNGLVGPAPSGPPSQLGVTVDSHSLGSGGGWEGGGIDQSGVGGN